MKKSYLMLPLSVIKSPAWYSLTAYEKGLLMDVAADYRGNNNGDISCTWSLMQTRGWKSKDTLGKALAGLLEKGFLKKTRQGGKRVCSLYALTWEPINEVDF